MASPGANPGGRNLDARRHPTDACGVDENAVAFAVIDHLRVAGDDPHARRARGLGHRIDHTAKHIHRKALF